MVIEVERMIAVLEARFDKYDKALAKASGDTNRTFQSIETRGKRFEAQMSGIGGKIGSTFKGLAAGFIAGVGIQSIESLGSALRGAVKDAADLVDMSDKVGINTDDLQRLIFGFGQAGVEADSVEQSLTQWGKRIGEAFTQGGPLAQLLKANNVSLTDGEGKLRSSVDLLREMADLIRNAGSDQERLTLSNVAFGKAGADMVVALKDGADGMNELMQETDKAGRVIEESVLRRAAEIDDRFDAIAHTIATGLKIGLIDSADVMVQMVDATAALVKNLEKASGIPAPQWIAAIFGLQGARADPVARLGALAGSLVGAEGSSDTRAPAKGDRLFQGLSDTDFASRFRGLPGRKTIVPDFGAAKAKKPHDNEYEREIKQIEARTKAIDAETTAQAGLNPLIDDYGFAADRARAVQDLLTAAQQAGVTVTPELRAQIEQLATGYATATAAAGELAESQDQVRQRMEEMRDLGKDVLGGFVDDLIAGKDAGEAFAGVLEKIGSKLIDIGINSVFDSKAKGGLDILGMLLGGGGSSFVPNTTLAGVLGVPGYASGTRNHPGGPAIVGEKGPELLNLPKGAQVIPNAQGAGSQRAQVDIAISVDDDGKIIAIARQTAGQAADVRIKQYAAGSFQRHLSNHGEARKRVRGYP